MLANRSLWAVVVLSSVFLLVLFSLSFTPYRIPNSHPLNLFHAQYTTKEAPTQLPESAIADLFRALYNPITPSITAPTFEGADGTIHDRPNRTLWTRPLGNDLCILDFDNRDFSSDDNVLSNGAFRYDNLQGTQPGILNHYLYGEQTVSSILDMIYV
jgi:hypothetical protein